MSVLRHPLSVDPLIKEARERTRRRRLMALVLGLVVAAAIATPLATRSSRNSPAIAGTTACGITATGTQIFQGGQAVYREPGHFVHPNGGPYGQVQCSGSTIWTVWIHGAGMSQEAYFGVRSGDGGRTWQPVFSEGEFGPKAPHRLDAYFGRWALRGNAAYFVGSCPACSVGSISSTVSLYVTKDGGQTFQTYAIPALTGFAPARFRVSGHSVTVVGDRLAPGLSRHKTATIRVD